MGLRPIPGQPGYLCSDDGRIFSTKSGQQREMALFVRGRQGHLGVNLTQDGKSRMHSVHTLVAITWIGPRPSPDHLVMHDDNDPANNRVGNLAWGLPKQNSEHMVICQRQARGERTAGAKLTADKVVEIKARMSAGELPSRIAEELGMSLSNICDIRHGRRWKHIT
jgi:hypothetical protein